jgi:hypothetical protein
LKQNLANADGPASRRGGRGLPVPANVKRTRRAYLDNVIVYVHAFTGGHRTGKAKTHVAHGSPEH